MTWGGAALFSSLRDDVMLPEGTKKPFPGPELGDLLEAVSKPSVSRWCDWSGDREVALWRYLVHNQYGLGGLT